jgi:hypothetical protein
MLLRIVAVSAIGLGVIFGLLAIIVVSLAPVFDNRLAAGAYAGIAAVLTYVGARLWIAGRRRDDRRQRGFEVEPARAAAAPHAPPPSQTSPRRDSERTEGAA